MPSSSFAVRSHSPTRPCSPARCTTAKERTWFGAASDEQAVGGVEEGEGAVAVAALNP